MSARTSSAETRTGRPHDPGGLQARLARQDRRTLWRAQKMAFWVLYDYAGPFILLNLFTLTATLGPAWALSKCLGGSLLWPVALAAALGVMAAAGQANIIVALLAEEEFSLRRFVSGVAAHGGRALALAVLMAGASGIAGVGAWFYAALLMASRPVAGTLLASLCISGGAVVVLTSVYLLPALVNQRGSMARALRTSFALAMRHPVLAAGLVALTAAQGILAATPPGLLLLSALPMVALGCCAYELLARRYQIEEALARGEALGTLANGPGVFDEDDIYLNRGFRDLLFPWKE